MTDPRHAIQSPPRRSRRTGVLAAVLSLALLPAVAFGQAEHLDKQTLIRGLADRNMSELLSHLAKTHPLKNPVANLQLKISTRELAARNASDSAARREATDGAIALLRQLIRKYPDRPRRPIWRTELAEKLLVDVLQDRHRDAPAFSEFGLMSETQENRFPQHVIEAYQALVRAERTLFERRRQGSSGNANAISSALQYRLRERLAKRRLPYYLAHAAYYLTLLPNEHPYYADPGGKGAAKTPGRRESPEAERQRLVQQAIGAVSPLAGGETAVADAVQRGAASLKGRALIAQAQYAPALETLNRALEQSGNERAGLLAALGKARALHRQGNHEQSYRLLRQARQNQPLAKQNLLYRVLVADLHYRLLMRAAGEKQGRSREKAEAGAFEPYRQLLSRGAVNAEQTDSLRDFIYRRLANRADASAEVASLPPMTRLAVTRMSRIEGQNRMQQARRQNNAQLQQQAADQLERAIKAGETFQNAGGSLSPALQARARFNVALARYFLSPQDVPTLVSVGKELVAIAQQVPGEPLAERAMAYGLKLLRTVHQQKNVARSARRAYVEAARALFESSFAGTDLAADERLYFGSAVLEPAGEYQQAAANYNQVPPDHPDYFKNQRRRLMALVQHLRGFEGQPPSRALDQLRRAAETVTQKAKPVVAQNEERTASAKGALAATSLARAEIAIAQNKTEAGLQRLGAFQRQYGDAGGLLAEAMRRHIMLLVREGRLADAADRAKTMFAQYPDRAPAVIQQALSRIQRDIERLRTDAARQNTATSERKRMREQAQQRARTAAQLAQLLQTWSQTQDLSPEQRLPFKLSLVQALRMAGRVGEARRLIEPMVNHKPYQNNAQVIHQYAETLFAKGTDKALKNAAPYYNKLIQGRQSAKGDLYWNAWMRRLQINDRLNMQTGVIPRRVQQLTTVSENLGGEPYRSTLRRLADKHRADG